MGADCVLTHREGVHRIGGRGCAGRLTVRFPSAHAGSCGGWDGQHGGLTGQGMPGDRARGPVQPSIHPSTYPVVARQAYCSILRPALISSLYAFNHVRVCVCVGWWMSWWVFIRDGGVGSGGGENSFFFSPPSAPSLGNSLPSLPASLPRRPLLMIYGCNGRGPQEGSGQSGLGRRRKARQGARLPGCPADLADWQVGTQDFQRIYRQSG